MEGMTPLFEATVRDQYGVVHWRGTVDAHDEQHARALAVEYAADDTADVYAHDPHKRITIADACTFAASAHRIPARRSA